MHILVVRNDKLGDFISSLPACRLLKSVLPDSSLAILVKGSISELATASNLFDDVLVDRPGDKWFRDRVQLSELIKEHEFDAVLTLFSSSRVGLAVRLARIPYRLAPATKVAQVFYNHRLRQRRSRSEKPEYEYNLELVRSFLSDQGIEDIPEPEPPYLEFDSGQIRSLRQEFCRQHHIDPGHRLVFVHPGHGGSAGHLRLEQYAQLIRLLASSHPFTVVLSAGPDELDLVRKLSALIPGIPHVVYHSTEGLVAFARHIAFADLFIAGSTGPLHIAGALDVPTAGFYTRRRSATALRWQTLNSPERRLAFAPPPEAGEEEMNAIAVSKAAGEISRRFLAATRDAAS
ncbi:MAG TPA: lipopolysaccharide heptosyltransferase family protein [Chromatiales bacterium]|nr:lipopolysaccharide heptosyltransferase family protein [Chromatiales bacterium]